MARILVVDDDPQTHHVLGVFLSAKGHCVSRAADPQEFLHIARAEKPELIILDVQMPGGGAPMATRMMEGTELADLPIVFISGMREAQMKQWFPANPHRRYLTKPIPLEQLGLFVQELLQG